ncbi:hypothetical protein Lser_V15G40518 [Lactuca serriola]
MRYELFVSMLEVYNEKICDLLVEDTEHPAKKLEIKQSDKGTQEVPRLSEVPVYKIYEVWELLKSKSRVRSFGYTNANELSSQSHYLLRAGTGIAELIALEISTKTHKKIWLMDSKGLIVSSRKEFLQHFIQPWAHEHEPLTTLLDVVKAIKPSILIGTSGVGQTFTKEVIEALAGVNERPLIMALSNPTSQAECTAEQAKKF